MMTNKTKNNSLLPYGTSSSAPAIKLPDLKLFHSERGSIARNYFENAAELLNKEFNELKELSELNDIVYGASYNFVPRVGQKYHLYQKEDGDKYFSMISPTEWTSKDLFLNSYFYDYDKTFVLV